MIIIGRGLVTLWKMDELIHKFYFIRHLQWYLESQEVYATDYISTLVSKSKVALPARRKLIFQPQFSDLGTKQSHVNEFGKNK